MESVSVSQLKAALMSLIARVRDTGRPLLVTDGGVPVVRLTPPPFAKREKQPESFGCMAHTILRVQEDLIDPFGLPVWEEIG